MNNYSKVDFRLLCRGIFFAIVLPSMLSGCGAAPIYLVPESENLPPSSVALLYRDGLFGGTLVSVDGKEIPYNSWAPSPVYIKEGEHDVTYIKWDYYGNIIRNECKADSGCKSTSEKTRTTHHTQFVEKCHIRVVGGITYTFEDVRDLLSGNGCKVFVGFPGAIDK